MSCFCAAETNKSAGYLVCLGGIGIATVLNRWYRTCTGLDWKSTGQAVDTVMIKIIMRILVAGVFVLGLSFGVMAQSGGGNNDDKRPPKNEKKDPPKIPIPPKNDRPKNDKKKPKPPEMEYGAVSFYIRED